MFFLKNYLLHVGLVFNFLLFYFILPLNSEIKKNKIKKELLYSFYIKSFKSENEAIQIRALNQLLKIAKDIKDHKNQSKYKISDKKIIPILKIPLNDTNILIRKKTVEILKILGFKKSVPILIRRISIESDIFIKRSIILALGSLKDNRIFFILKKYLTSKELIIRIATKKALKNYNYWRNK